MTRPIVTVFALRQRRIQGALAPLPVTQFIVNSLLKTYLHDESLWVSWYRKRQRGCLLGSFSRIMAHCLAASLDFDKESCESREELVTCVEFYSIPTIWYRRKVVLFGSQFPYSIIYEVPNHNIRIVLFCSQ